MRYKIKKNLVGMTFNRLTVIELAEEDHTRILKWLCKCICGNTAIVRGDSLLYNHTKSCGCLQKEKVSNHAKTYVHDLLGKQFGRLTVISRSDNTNDGATRWLCKCSCGNTKIIRSKSLIREETRSCGCLQKEIQTKHGKAHTSEYHIYKSMMSRCYNIDDISYHNYGARGITVCDRWNSNIIDFEIAFTNFLDDMGERPFTNASIDRIDNNGNYEQSNCKWSTPTEQHRNTRRNVIKNIEEANIIRKLYDDGNSVDYISHIYNCSISTIYNIVANRSWT